MVLIFLAGLLILIILFACRLFWILTCLHKNQNFPGSTRKGKRIKCMIVLGSGGHTAEMLRLIGALNLKQYSPRHYVIANTDSMSMEKMQRLESDMSQVDISRIPRSREVKQSWLTTVITTIYASLYSFPLVFRSLPDLILVNGPGTCIPICVAAFILTVLGKKVHIVFVESLCRVQSLSLSGKILYYFADELFVQWPELQTLYPRTHYLGRIV